MRNTVNNRLLALDVLRGITIAGMILVNNPGSWGYVYAPFQHASWHGLTPTDLVFPFFMFIMGISTYISLRKYHFEYSHAAAWKILRRTLVIFAIGLVIAWFALFCQTLDPFPFAHIRILGVMQRLALCYGATALIALTLQHRHIPYLIAALLLGYFVLLMIGNGFEYNEESILSLADRTVLGENHMIGIIDPEGLLSTVASIAHVLIGFCVGRLLMEAKEIDQKLLRLFLVGTILTFAGFLLSYGCPINKKIWSPTFVLVTCGLASTFLALLVWIIDVKGYQRWSRFFESFGVNPLFIYVMAAFLSILLSSLPVEYKNECLSVQEYFCRVVLMPLLGNYAASLAYALLFVGINWVIGYWLYTKKLYIKI